MTILHAIILGMVEGVTEFLPVSSTGHLILTSHLLGLAESEFIKSFEVIIQLGAIGAIIALYARTLLRSKGLLVKVAVGFVPTGVVGLVLYSFVKAYLLGSVPIVIGALSIGGIILIIFEYFKKADGGVGLEFLSHRQAFLIGVAQTLALVPGVSRSAATIVAGRSLRLSRTAAVEFSFLLSIPTILAASGLDIVQHGGSFGSGQIGLLMLGFVVSFFVAWIVSVAFLRFVRTYTLVPFGVYRIIVSVILFVILFI